MKNARIICMTILLSAAVCSSAQDRLQRAMDRYEYGTAVHILDSLIKDASADSTAIGKNKDMIISLSLQKARCLKRLYRTEEAAGALADVLHLDQFNMGLLAELAECHTQSGRSEEAFRLYSILSGLQPENVYFRICQARILYREKQYEESIGICKDLIAKDSIPEIISMTADAYKNLGKADSALVYYNHVLRMKPGHVPTISKKADIMLSAKQYLPVIEMTREYLQDDPDNMTILPIHGLALHLQGSYPLSIETFEHQRELGDESYPVHYYLGLNHYMMSNWPRAVSELDKAYQIDSSDVTLVYQLAHAKSHMTQWTGLESRGLNRESERLYAKALDMLKPSPTMMHNVYGSMAMARHRTENFRDAIKYYELSYHYNPKNISALSSIGYCYERLKEYDKALEYYQQYLKVGKAGTSGYKFAQESIDYIKQEKFMEER